MFMRVIRRGAVLTVLFRTHCAPVVLAVLRGYGAAPPQRSLVQDQVKSAAAAAEATWLAGRGSHRVVRDEPELHLIGEWRSRRPGVRCFARSRRSGQRWPLI